MLCLIVALQMKCLNPSLRASFLRFVCLYFTFLKTLPSPSKRGSILREQLQLGIKSISCSSNIESICYFQYGEGVGHENSFILTSTSILYPKLAAVILGENVGGESDANQSGEFVYFMKDMKKNISTKGKKRGRYIQKLETCIENHGNLAADFSDLQEA